MDRGKGCTPFIKMYMDAEEAVRTEGRKQNLLRRAAECVGKRDRFSRFLSSDHGPMRLLGNFPFLSEHFSRKEECSTLTRLMVNMSHYSIDSYTISSYKISFAY